MLLLELARKELVEVGSALPATNIRTGMACTLEVCGVPVAGRLLSLFTYGWLPLVAQASTSRFWSFQTSMQSQREERSHVSAWYFLVALHILQSSCSGKPIIGPLMTS